MYFPLANLHTTIRDNVSGTIPVHMSPHISYYYRRKRALILALFVVALLLLVSLAGIFSLPLRDISPRSRITEKFVYPEDSEKMRKWDIYFPVFTKSKNMFDYRSYRERLHAIETRETIGAILVLELLRSREDKHRTLDKPMVSVGTNRALILPEIFLLILLLV